MFKACRISIICLLLACAVLISCRGNNNRCVPIEHPRPNNGNTPVLLFDGTGTSTCDVIAIENILESNHINYATANSHALNGMASSQLREYKVLIIPGGNFIDMGKSLSNKTATNIHTAVNSGLNYLGICAGAFLAGNSSYYNSFNLTGGAKFGFYFAANKGLSKTVAAITDADGKTLDQYWENGPQLSGWGNVIGKYPDGTPAIAQGRLGKGFVILTGIHAEAPEYWRGDMVFATPASVDNAYAANLIRAALTGTAMRHY